MSKLEKVLQQWFDKYVKECDSIIDLSVAKTQDEINTLRNDLTGLWRTRRVEQLSTSERQVSLVRFPTHILKGGTKKKGSLAVRVIVGKKKTYFYAGKDYEFYRVLVSGKKVTPLSKLLDAIDGVNQAIGATIKSERKHDDVPLDLKDLDDI